MRRRRKRKQKKIKSNVRPYQRFYCKDCEEFAETIENRSKKDQCEICPINNRSIRIYGEDVTTQTEEVQGQEGVSKNRNNIGFQFPEEIITLQQRSKFGKSSKKSAKQHLVINKNRQIHLCYIRRAALHKCRPLSTQSGLFVRTIEGVLRLLVRLRNNTVAISKAFLDGFIYIGTLLEIWLELSFKARNKLSEENLITPNEDNLLILEQKLDIISKDIATLKNIILGECAQINQRINDVEANQNHLESILHKANAAKTAAPIAFVPPPPPPLPPSTIIEYNESKNTFSTLQNNAKRSISNINVRNERITITVEDLRNVKLRPRSTKDSSAMQNQQPFISPQMLNGVKLRPTSNVIITAADGSVSDSTAMARQQSVKSSGKFNTL